MKRKKYLSPDGEKTAAGGVHENEFALITGVGLVRVDSEDERALGVVDGEAVTGEEEGGLENSELGLFLVHEPTFDNRSGFHLRRPMINDESDIGTEVSEVLINVVF